MIRGVPLKTFSKLFLGVVTTLVFITANIPSFNADASNDPTNTASYFVYITLSKPELKLYKDTHLVKSYSVALGKPSTQTPIGLWRIREKHREWGGGFGSRWMGLNVPWGTYGIHGTNRPASIGHYVSNGCIRMQNSDVEELYRILPIGTSVQIVGNPLRHLRRLEYGNIGADVQLVQQQLKQRGFYAGTCDGRFGPATQFALTYFQLNNHLPMVGSVGLKEYKKLGLL